jgi:hypothetical protein
LQQFQDNDTWNIGEVQYFFLLESGDDDNRRYRAFAVVSIWSDHDAEIWKDSNHTVWFSQYQGQGKLAVMECKHIDSCVAMVPHTIRGREGSFLVEKPGLGAIGDGEYREDAERADDAIDIDSDNDE